MGRYRFAAAGGIGVLAVAVPLALVLASPPKHIEYRTELPESVPAVAREATGSVPAALTAACAKKTAPKPVVYVKRSSAPAPVYGPKPRELRPWYFPYASPQDYYTRTGYGFPNQ